MSTTAFSTAYPPGRSIAGRIFGPVVEPRAYLRAFHLLLMFPLGVAYFVFFVTAFAVGGSLIWTFVGAAIILLAMFVSLRLGDLEATLVSAVSGVPIKRPPQRLEGVTSLRQKFWARAIDPATWTGLLYLKVQFPFGIAALAVVTATFSTAGALLGSPLIIMATGEPLNLFGSGTPAFVLDTPTEALPLVPLGAAVWIVALHVVALFSAFHATWARFMLGSRTRRRPGLAEPPVIHPPDPPPSTPAQAPPPALREIAQPEAVTITPPREWQSRPELTELTPREREVTLLLACGMSNAEIAETCFISEGTVKTHVKRILAKLNLHDRTQVVVFAYENGLVRPGMHKNRSRTENVIPFERRLKQQP